MSLTIETGHLYQKPERICGEESAAFLELDLEDQIRPQGHVVYDLTVQRVSDKLIVRGTLEISFRCRCARCGDNFSKNILVSDFCRNFTLTSKNDLINLTPEMREDILLSLPMVVVCSDTCRGLCALCSVNLNRENCKCSPRSKPDAWRMLEGLRFSRETRDL